MAARKRLAHGFRRPLPINPCAAGKLQQVMDALSAPGISGADALALREQWRREDAAKRSAQGCLRLGAAG